MRSNNLNPRSLAWLVVPLLLSSSCLSQDRGKMTLTDEELLGLCGQRHSPDVIHLAALDLERVRFNANGVAGSLLRRSGTVVDGEFYGIPEPREGELERLDREQVSFSFRVDRVYTGSAPDTIKVEAVSDMLAYPDKHTTRYAERMRILEYQDAILQPISDQIHALRRLFDKGQITRKSYMTHQMSLFDQVEETAAAHGFKVTDHTEVRPIHFSTYYDHGEGISENKPFLVYFDAELNESDTQVLDEVLTPIYSGERREDIIEAMTSPEGIVLPHPFRGYDPTDDRDCATLRELVGAPKPVPQPSEVARQLLDEFDLVALGEFIDIPETVGEELKGYASDAVRMISIDLPISFRIDRVYKGEAPAVLELELNSDMLEFPGSGVSRYVRRGRIFEDLSRLDEEWVEALGWRLSVEDIGVELMDMREAVARDPDYSEKEAEYFDKQDEYFESIGGIPDDRTVYSYFADTFYDRGGVIRPYDSYLIAINRERDSFGLWRVSDTREGPSRIYWGDEAAELVRQLETLAR